MIEFWVEETGSCVGGGGLGLCMPRGLHLFRTLCPEFERRSQITAISAVSSDLLWEVYYWIRLKKSFKSIEITPWRWPKSRPIPSRQLWLSTSGNQNKTYGKSSFHPAWLDQVGTKQICNPAQPARGVGIKKPCSPP